MTWLNLEELLVIHAQVIEETGGVRGLLNVGGVETALRRPFTAFGGQDMFPELREKVAVLIHSIIAFHPFLDGNKRTALVAADVCLRLHGFRLTPSDEVEPFFWSIARGEQTIEAIADWLETHIEAWHEEDGHNR